ncbi:MAG: right-handed parallel beta-helix repeat-containing protein [Candidatus Thermoplasmatota archaeon]|nr:right-handed parallel beta-helix repeat-containing protein [Candidatus Thermoplasmatota archaeon]
MRWKVVRWIVLLLICLILTSVSVSAIESNSLKSIIIVSKNAKGDYQTINEAINNAAEGAIIYIGEGYYDESININKKIILIGLDKIKTIINPVSIENAYAIRLGAPGVEVKNLTIINGAPGLYTTGIKITTTGNRIENCVIENTPVGIAIWSSENLIENCSFIKCNDEGIALMGSNTRKCEKNQIKNCSFYSNCDGIELQYSSNNLITDCIFRENYHTGIDAIREKNNNNTIAYCTIANNDVHGIYLSASSENRIIRCDITENRDGNIYFDKGSTNNELIPLISSNTEKTKQNFITSNTPEYYSSTRENEASKSSTPNNIFEIFSSLIASILNLFN